MISINRRGQTYTYVHFYTILSVPLRQIFSGIGPVPKFVVSRLVGSQSRDGNAKSKRWTKEASRTVCSR